MCILHVKSLNSTFEDFLKNTKLPFYQSHEAGEQKGKTKYKYTDSGFSCIVSDNEYDDAESQIEDIKLFITKYNDALIKLIEADIVDYIIFDIPVVPGLKDIIVQYDFLPTDFLDKCGQFGIDIEVNYFPKLENED